jgi:uncharacterized membrane protein
MSYVVMALFYLLFPALVIRLCLKSQIANKLGAVIICYIGGIAFGNIGILSPGVSSFQNTLTEALIAVGLSLLLFTMDIKEWRKTAGVSILSFALATASIIVIAFLGVRLIKGSVPDAWKLGGMAIGVYTGGTPNLAAIKAALNVDNDTYILMHTYDTVFSLLYILFCSSLAQRLFGLFLPKFEPPAETGGLGSAEKPEAVTSYSGMFRPKVMLGLTGALGLALAVTAAGLGISTLVPKEFSTAAAILAITSIAIGLSFVGKVRRTEKSFQFGMYFIYMFCTVVASMVRVSDIVHLNWPMIGFVVLCIFGSMALHAILCKIFKIDADTFIITSVSAICSPPFVPVVAAGLKNHYVIIAGITTGIIGYAIGNYLGISFAFLMR